MSQLRWEELNTGDEGQPLEYVITERTIEQFAEAVGDYHDWYMKSSPFGERVAPVTLTATDYFALIFLRWRREWTGLHTRQETQVTTPLKLGQKAKVTGRVVDKYEKKGRKYIGFEYITRDENGAEVVRHKITTTID